MMLAQNKILYMFFSKQKYLSIRRNSCDKKKNYATEIVSQALSALTANIYSPLIPHQMKCASVCDA